MPRYSTHVRLDGGGFDAATINLFITDIPVGTYTVLVYAHGDSQAESQIVYGQSDPFGTPTNLDARTTTNDETWDSADWAPGRQYVLYEDVVTSDGDLLLIVRDAGSTNIACLNCIQLIKTA